jgi:polar amino acid transport system substrate-binding protein
VPTTLPSSNRTHRLKAPALRVAVLVAATALLAAACSSGTSTNAGASGTKSAPASTSSVSASATADASAVVAAKIVALNTDNAARALLPASIQSTGVINAAGTASIPPLDFYAPGTTTLEGFDVDLSSAISKVLGVKWNRTVGPFAAQITGVQSNRYDLAMGDVGDVATRKTAADFVDYLNLNFSVEYPKTNPAGLKTLLDLCGAKTGLTQGEATAGLSYLQNACKAAGKPAPVVTTYADDAAHTAALESGRIDGEILLTPKTAYDKAQPNSPLTYFEVPQLGEMTIGIVTPKGATALQSGLVAALKDLVANGTYGSILAKWGLTSLAHNDPGVDQGPSFSLYG